MNHWQNNLAVKLLKRGGIIAYPTESVYGLGCDATNLNAIAQLLSIKNRPQAKGLIILVSHIEQAFEFIAPLNQQQIETIKQPNIRATTWLLNKSSHLSPLLVGKHDKIAVRVTSNPVAKNLCQLLNKPLVSTSCNLSSKPASSHVSIVRNQMKMKLNLILSGSCGGQLPSRIVDLQSSRIIRE